MTITLNTILAEGDYTIENAQGTIVDYANPVWTPALNVADGNSNSYYPALFESGHTQSVLQLGMTLGPEFQNISIHMLGVWNGAVVFQSDSSNGSVGAWSPQAHLLNTVPGLARVAGDFGWYVVNEVDGSQSYLATTRLELTWIYQEPADFYNGISQSLVLRPLFAQLNGATMADIVANVADYAYFGFNKTYDVQAGGPHFVAGPYGGSFQLGQYLSLGTQQQVNCYDQAGIVQILLGSLGLPSAWAYMNPFGFINTTDLIGTGLCNNPFYGSNNTTPVVSENDPYRTSFGNHAFVLFNNMVIDACAGPHTGAESLNAYINAAIDTQTTLPGNTGTAADVSDEAGISSLSMALPASEDPEYIGSLKKLLGPRDRLLAALPDSTALVNWAQLMQDLRSDFQLTLVHHGAIAATDGVLASWLLEREQAVLEVRVFRAKNRLVALSRAIDYLAAFQHDPAACLMPAPSFGAAGLQTADQSLVIFIHRNAFVVVSGMGIGAGAIASRIHAALDGAPLVPHTIGYQTTRLSLNVGDRRALARDQQTTHSLTGNAIRIAARDHQELQIVARKVGKSRLLLSRINEASLDLNLQDFDIQVLP
ncbi:hypothetical protein RugamoR64_38590 [Duganella rhizosphaerae]|uniref:hypothetical protein n=1 Tax=Duganella rhizosphaerae TaxID=2885763 RepID=UPI0030E75CA3